MRVAVVYRWYVLALAAIALAPVVLRDTRVFPTLVLAGAFVSLVLSLQLIFGLAGQLSLAQAALFGIGAYSSAYLTTRLGWEPLLAMAVGVLLSVGVAALLSPILRLRGFFFALASLAFAVVIEELFGALDPITGGPSGFTNIHPFAVGGWVLARREEVGYFYLLWGLAAACLLLNINIARSRFGRALLAINEDDQAAAGLGIHVAAHTARIWLLAAAYASVAGSLYAHYLGFISPAQFGLWPEILVVMMLIVGGLQTTFGPIFGTLLARLVPDAAAFFQDWSQLVFGLVLVLVMMFVPDGLGSLGLVLPRRSSGPPGEAAASGARAETTP